MWNCRFFLITGFLLCASGLRAEVAFLENVSIIRRIASVEAHCDALCDCT